MRGQPQTFLSTEQLQSFWVLPMVSDSREKQSAHLVQVFK
jgi:hypothetical protein